MQEALLICHQASFISHLSVEDGSYIKWKSLETVDHMNINKVKKWLILEFKYIDIITFKKSFKVQPDI